VVCVGWGGGWGGGGGGAGGAKDNGRSYAGSHISEMSMAGSERSRCQEVVHSAAWGRPRNQPAAQLDWAGWWVDQQQQQGQD
jgi:hypothetical protein